MKLSIFKRAFQRDINLIRLIFAMITISTIGLIYKTSIDIYADSAKELKSNYQKCDSIINASLNSSNDRNDPIKTLKDYNSIIQNLKANNLYMAEKFSKYEFAFSTLFCIFSVITGILTFLILKKGWDNTSNFYVKFLFLVSFFCSTLFGILPHVFSTEENASNNLKNYHEFTSLQLDIKSLINDDKGYLKRNKKQSLDSLSKEILNIKKQLQENIRLTYKIDLTKVSTSNKPFE
ncbi:hypothetical protein [Chryseobacterium sp.]|uniref:hypothetical protein n=1 Tax=Chryseobacterium sp. TaxID=1871047 RepID=UPI0025C179B9|nr:hypothetical protein [Chryseobacterium sp.]MBV8327999.1 hypothetical protein [Chryseobacterium sp.]